MKPPVSVVKICRYPVKGLSAELLERVALSAAKWLPKTSFVMLMRDEKLAQLRW